jgi:hypothetical protein
MSVAMRNLDLSRYEPFLSPGGGPNYQGFDSRARQETFLHSRTLFNEE